MMRLCRFSLTISAFSASLRETIECLKDQSGGWYTPSVKPMKRPQNTTMIQKASDRPPEFAQGMCRDPGEFSSSVGVSIDAPADGELNQLFLESDADAEDNVYHLRVYVAAERDPGQVWWEPGEILAERTYDHQFGELEEQDSFVVDYDGVRYTVDVVGLPAASTCAARAADSVDAVQ